MLIRQAPYQLSYHPRSWKLNAFNTPKLSMRDRRLPRWSVCALHSLNVRYENSIVIIRMRLKRCTAIGFLCVKVHWNVLKHGKNLSRDIPCVDTSMESSKLFFPICLLDTLPPPRPLTNNPTTMIKYLLYKNKCWSSDGMWHLNRWKLSKSVNPVTIGQCPSPDFQLPSLLFDSLSTAFH